MADATTSGKGPGMFSKGLMGTVVMPAVYGVVLATIFGNFVPEMFSILFKNTSMPMTTAIPRALQQALEPFMAITDPNKHAKISSFGWQFAGAFGGIFFNRLYTKEEKA